MRRTTALALLAAGLAVAACGKYGPPVRRPTVPAAEATTGTPAVPAAPSPTPAVPPEAPEPKR